MMIASISAKVNRNEVKKYEQSRNQKNSKGEKC